MSLRNWTSALSDLRILILVSLLSSQSSTVSATIPVPPDPILQRLSVLDTNEIVAVGPYRLPPQERLGKSSWHPYYQRATGYAGAVPMVHGVHSFSGLQSEYSQAHAILNANRRDASIWQSDEAKLQLLQAFHTMAHSGIYDDFAHRYQMLHELYQSQHWAQFEYIATDSLLLYASYLEQLSEKGRTWLFHQEPIIRIAPPSQGMIRELQIALQQDIALWLKRQQPGSVQYHKLVHAMNQLDLSPSQFQVPEYPGVIRYGRQLTPEISEALVGALGLQESAPERYNAVLVSAVEAFQARHGLKVDGVIGPNTWQWLFISNRKRYQLLALNAERARLWPAGQDNLLLVNIPAYQLDLWLNQEHVLASKVIVGRPSRQTPIFDSRINTLVVNPAWNVPRSIQQKDILPKAQLDPSYLLMNHYQIIDGWRHDSPEIAVHTIDWTTVTPKSFRYRLRQRPGSWNALGKYKFSMPNTSAIYLHDTNAKGLFEKSQRALSSGCIRVEQADALAVALLTHSGYRDTSMARYFEQTETKYLPVHQQIPTYAIYQTAWVDEQGEVQFRDDIYHFDSPKPTPQG